MIIINEFIEKKNKDIIIYLLNEIQFLLSNLKSEKILNILYSTKFENNDDYYKLNIFDKLILYDNEQKNKEEFLNNQVSLMKSLLLKIDEKTIIYFYDQEINKFPILEKALYLYDNPEPMIRSVIKNILLLITKIKNKSLICFLTAFPVAMYYPNLIYKFKVMIENLNINNLAKNINIHDYLGEKFEELYDAILYINDILLCEEKNINFVLYNCLLNEIIFPMLNIIISKKKEKISIIHAIYILSFILYNIKNEFIFDLISFFLFQEKIPKIIYDKIINYQYQENKKNFMNDINILIKNLNEVDINDDEWKKNSEFIKKDIGLDLSTGIVLEDNNFKFFQNYFKNIKEKNYNNSSPLIQNEIFKYIKELLNSKDDNIILNVNLLLYIIINYYYKKNENLTKNIKDKNDEIFNSILLNEDDGTKVKNRIRNFNISHKNNLEELSNINNNKNHIKSKTEIKKNKNNEQIFINPLLLQFLSISEQNDNNNNNITLFTLLLNLIKKEKNFRVISNEIILNIIKILIQIYFKNQKITYTETEINILKSKIFQVLNEEIKRVKLLIKDNDCGNLAYFYTIFSYNYCLEDFSEKIKYLMTSCYILIPFDELEDNEKINFSITIDKNKNELFRNHMINIFLFLDIIQFIDSKNNISKNNKNKNKSKTNCNLGPFEIEKDIILDIGKIYKKKDLGKEFGFCFTSNKIEDFENNVKNIKKCVFILTKYDFYLGVIESNTFKDLSRIKIFFKIPLRFIRVQVPPTDNESFLEIIDIRNENTKIIMNCFDSENTKKTNNYLLQMISNSILLEKSLFDTFLESIQIKCS